MNCLRRRDFILNYTIVNLQFDCRQKVMKGVKSIMKRLASIILVFAVVLCAGISLAGCNDDTQIETYGDFLYSVEYYNEAGERVIKEKGVRSGIMIRGLSEVGKEKEIIVVPESINGIKVQELGSQRMWGAVGIWENEELKKVFILGSVNVASGIFYKCNCLEKVISLSHDINAFNVNGRGRIYNDNGTIPVYLTSYHYSEEYTTNFYKYRDVGPYFFSNVSFRYNYDNEPNDGYYWINDCDYGCRIDYIPEPPTREGNTFEGWYKESECINKWDFETDTLPQAQYNEDNEEIYQETKLYAKWIKN